MKKSTTVNFAGRNVSVNELTVAQVAGFLADVKADEEAMTEYRRKLKANTEKEENVVELPKPIVRPHALDLLMDSAVPFYLVRQCVPDLSEQEFTEGVTPSELAPLYKAVEEVNPFFLRMAADVLGKAKRKAQVKTI